MSEKNDEQVERAIAILSNSRVILGYRILKSNELVQEGDEYSVNNGITWEQVWPRRKVGYRQSIQFKYRRPIYGD